MSKRRLRPLVKCWYSFNNNNSLWLADDYLMSMSRNGYTENYRRFFIRDIQAFAYKTNRRRLWLSAILLLPMVGFASVALGVQSWSVLATGLVLHGMAIGWNIIRGPGATAYLQTAVQTVKLPAVTRQYQAEAIRNALFPLIAEEQGRLSDEQRQVLLAHGTTENLLATWEAANRTEEAAPTSSAAAPEPEPAPDPGVPPPDDDPAVNTP